MPFRLTKPLTTTCPCVTENTIYEKKKKNVCASPYVCFVYSAFCFFFSLVQDVLRGIASLPERNWKSDPFTRDRIQ